MFPEDRPPLEIEILEFKLRSIWTVCRFENRHKQRANSGRTVANEYVKVTISQVNQAEAQNNSNTHLTYWANCGLRMVTTSNWRTSSVACFLYEVHVLVSFSVSFLFPIFIPSRTRIYCHRYRQKNLRSERQVCDRDRNVSCLERRILGYDFKVGMGTDGKWETISRYISSARAAKPRVLTVEVGGRITEHSRPRCFRLGAMNFLRWTAVGTRSAGVTLTKNRRSCRSESSHRRRQPDGL